MNALRKLGDMQRLLCCMALLMCMGAAGATYFDRPTMAHDEVITGEISAMAHFHEPSGRWLVSADGGKTWVDRIDFEAENPDMGLLSSMMGEVSETQRRFHAAFGAGARAFRWGLWLMALML